MILLGAYLKKIINMLANKKITIGIFFAYIIIAIIYFYEPLSRGYLIAPGDSLAQNYPLRLYYSYAGLKNILWIPYEFLGLPFLGTLQTGLLYPFNFLYFILPAPFVFNLNLILHYALAAFFTFLYARFIGAKNFPSFIAGLVFGFSGFLMAHKGHTSMVNAAIWLPLLLYLFEKIRRTMKASYAAFAAIIVAVQVFAGHYQICIYTYLVLGLYGIYYLPDVNKGKRAIFLALCFGSVLVGSLISLPQLLATKELSNTAFRVGQGYAFFTEGSFPPYMLPSLVLPYFFGEAYGVANWGGWNMTELSGFTGLLPLLIAAWTAIRLKAKSKHITFLSILAIFAFLLVIGRYNPFYRLMYYIPVYNLFRIPARNWLEFDLAVAVLCALGLQYLLYDQSIKGKRKEIVFLFTGLGLGVLFLILAGKNVVSNHLIAHLIKLDDQNIAAHLFSFHNLALVIPLSFIILYLAIFYWLAKIKSPKWKNIFLVATSIAVLAEGFSFGGFHDVAYPKISDISVMQDNSIFSFLKENAKYERSVFINNSTLPLFNVPAGVSTLNGYDPLIQNNMHVLLSMSAAGISDNWLNLLQNNIILSTLNTRYIILPKDETKKYILNQMYAISDGAPEYSNVPIKQWSFIDSLANNRSEYILKSPDGKAVSMIDQQISLQPNTNYLISLETRTPGSNPTAALCFDLYGKNYDFPEQELDVNPQKINNIYHNYYKVINTGANIPQIVDLRLFTFSQNPIIVRNIKVKKMSDYYPPCIGINQKGNGNIFPLYKKVSEDDKYIVYKNNNCLPRAFTINNLLPVANIEDDKMYFDLLKFNPGNTALVRPGDLNKIGRVNFSRGMVNINEYHTNKVSMNADFALGPGFLVLSDQYFPGWKAYIDGRESPIYQVDGLLRGVVVPSGKHKVDFIYRPVTIFAGGIGSLVIFIATTIIFIRIR